MVRTRGLQRPACRNTPSVSLYFCVVSVRIARPRDSNTPMYHWYRLFSRNSLHCNSIIKGKCGYRFYAWLDSLISNNSPYEWGSDISLQDHRNHYIQPTTTEYLKTSGRSVTRRAYANRPLTSCSFWFCAIWNMRGMCEGLSGA